MVVLALSIGACVHPTPQAPAAAPIRFSAELDAIFDATPFERALVGVRVESLDTGRVIYQRNDDKLVMPASNMKIVTLAVAAERLGWDFTFETRLEAAGAIDGGTLKGDLVVTGTGDPSIASLDFVPASTLESWADGGAQPRHPA